MSLGKRIRFYREKARWRLEDLSARSGVDGGTINALEMRNSKRSNYTPAIAAAFGLTVEQLLDEARDWVANPPRYPAVTPSPAPIARNQPRSRIGSLSTREEDVVLALRALSQRQRDQFIAELMKAHEDANQFATEVLRRHGVRGNVVSDEHAAAHLPEHPEGPQTDSLHGSFA